jgi:hypothetical protein
MHIDLLRDSTPEKKVKPITMRACRCSTPRRST